MPFLKDQRTLFPPCIGILCESRSYWHLVFQIVCPYRRVFVDELVAKKRFVVIVVDFILSRLLYLAFSANLGLLD